MKKIDTGNIRRGDIYFIEVGSTVGSEQRGRRPAIILSNNVGNRHGSTVIAAMITSAPKRLTLPTHVPVSATGLLPNSLVLLEQIRTVDKRRLISFIGHLGSKEMRKVDDALMVSLGLTEINQRTCRGEQF